MNRQDERPENFSFYHKGVLFFGLNHVSGKNIVDQEEWEQRDRDNLMWARQNLFVYMEARAVVMFTHAIKLPNHLTFFLPFLEEAVRFGKPILFMHGDGHVWEYEPLWNGIGASRVLEAKNILRVQVDQGARAPPVKVTVGFDTTNPFSFDRRLG